MTVRDFACLCEGSAILHIATAGAAIMYFDSQYWEYITDDVLDLEIESFSINNQLMKKAEVFITVVSGETETEPGPDENPDEDPDENPDTEPDDTEPGDDEP